MAGFLVTCSRSSAVLKEPSRVFPRLLGRRVLPLEFFSPDFRTGGGCVASYWDLNGPAREEVLWDGKFCSKSRSPERPSSSGTGAHCVREYVHIDCSQRGNREECSFGPGHASVERQSDGFASLNSFSFKRHYCSTQGALDDQEFIPRDSTGSPDRANSQPAEPRRASKTSVLLGMDYGIGAMEGMHSGYRHPRKASGRRVYLGNDTRIALLSPLHAKWKAQVVATTEGQPSLSTDPNQALLLNESQGFREQVPKQGKGEKVWNVRSPSLVNRNQDEGGHAPGGSLAATRTTEGLALLIRDKKLAGQRIIQEVLHARRLPDRWTLLDLLRQFQGLEYSWQSALRVCDAFAVAGLKPEPIFFATLITLMGNVRQILWVGRLFDAALEAGCGDMSVVLSTIDAYSTVQAGELALQVDIVMRQKGLRRNASVYVKLIRICCACSRWHESSRLLDEMVADGFVPRIELCNHVLTRLATAGQADAMLGLLARMPELGCHPNEASYSTAIRGFRGTGRWQDGLALLDRARALWPQLAAEAWYSAIQVCGSVGEAREAMRVLVDAGKEGIELNLVSWESVIWAYKHPKCRSLEAAEAVFQLLLVKGYKPTQDTWLCLIVIACLCGRRERASELMKEMKQQGLFLTWMHWKNDLNSLMRSKNWHDIDLLLDSMGALGFPFTPPMISVLLAGYGRQGMWERCMQLYSRVVSMGLRPERGTFNIMTKALAFNGQVERAIEFLKSAHPDGEPGQSEFFSLLEGCERLGQWDQLAQVLSWMYSAGHRPDPLLYQWLARSYKESGATSAALEALL